MLQLKKAILPLILSLCKFTDLFYELKKLNKLNKIKKQKKQKKLKKLKKCFKSWD